LNSGYLGGNGKRMTTMVMPRSNKKCYLLGNWRGQRAR